MPTAIDHSAPHPRGDLRRRHKLAADHRRHGAGGVVRRRVFHAGESDKEILEEFPACIVLTIIGVTYFFSMAQRNGSIDIIIQTCVRLVRGKTMLLPWVFFLWAAALTALSTFSPAAVALLAPAALGLAYDSRIYPVLMGAFVINGAHAGGFSPLSVAGVLVHDIALKNGFPVSQGGLFTASFALNFILSALTIVLSHHLGEIWRPNYHQNRAQRATSVKRRNTLTT